MDEGLELIKMIVYENRGGEIDSLVATPTVCRQAQELTNQKWTESTDFRKATWHLPWMLPWSRPPTPNWESKMVTNRDGFGWGIELKPSLISSWVACWVGRNGAERSESAPLSKPPRNPPILSRRPSTLAPILTAQEETLAAQPAPLSFPPGSTPTAPTPPRRRGLPRPGCSSGRPRPQRGRVEEARLAPTCSPASWWPQHLAMLLQLPRARASLIALALYPRCQSAVPVQGHRDPKSGGGCSWRAREGGPERACVRALVSVLLRWRRAFRNLLTFKLESP